jgi:hypothetical protein
MFSRRHADSLDGIVAYNCLSLRLMLSDDELGLRTLLIVILLMDGCYEDGLTGHFPLIAAVVSLIYNLMHLLQFI